MNDRCCIVKRGPRSRCELIINTSRFWCMGFSATFCSKIQEDFLSNHLPRVLRRRPSVSRRIPGLLLSVTADVRARLRCCRRLPDVSIERVSSCDLALSLLRRPEASEESASSGKRFRVLRRRFSSGSSLTRIVVVSLGAPSGAGTNDRRGFRRGTAELPWDVGDTPDPSAERALGIPASGEESQSLDEFCSIFGLGGGFESSSGSTAWLRAKCKACTFVPID